MQKNHYKVDVHDWISDTILDYVDFLSHVLIDIFSSSRNKKAVSYLGVFRRHFAPAILSKKETNCPQPVWLFSLWGQGGRERYGGAPRRVIVPGTLSGPDAHPRPSTEGILKCFSVAGGRLWWTEPRGVSSSSISSSSTPLPALRVCSPSAECRRRGSAWIKCNEMHEAARQGHGYGQCALMSAHVHVYTHTHAHTRR